MEVSGKLTLTPSSVNSEKQPENKSSKKQLFDSYELGNMSRIEGTKVNSNGKRKYDKIKDKTAHFSPKKMPKTEKNKLF